MLLALPWLALCSYAGLGNQAHADEGLIRLTVITAMAAMFVVALTDSPSSSTKAEFGWPAAPRVRIGGAVRRRGQEPGARNDQAEEAPLAGDAGLTKTRARETFLLLARSGKLTEDSIGLTVTP